MLKIISLLSLSLLVLSGCIDKNVNQDGTPVSVIQIEKAYVFATMPGAQTGAAFMVIKNTSDVDDVLISAQSNVSEITEIHQNIIDPDDGMMMMRKIRTLDIPSGESVILEPKGYHIMFIKMKEPLTLGAVIPVKMTFEKAGTIETNVEIIQPGAQYGKHTDHSGH